MPREIITIQIGQCGIQVGTEFWCNVLREHATAEAYAANANGTNTSTSNHNNNTGNSTNAAIASLGNLVVNNTALETFFDVSSSERSKSAIKARAILVDTETGPLSSLLQSPLSSLFTANQMIADLSGAGNNFACGYYEYGERHGPAILELFRQTIERCESLQSFLFCSSVGGGTGSGLGGSVLRNCIDEFPDVLTFTLPVLPSFHDDVITSPYNAICSISKHIDAADGILPIDNESLSAHCRGTSDSTKGDTVATKPKCSISAFSEMNVLAANVWTSLTAGMRFPGDLNVDLNEVAQNLVPLPDLKFLVPAISPVSEILDRFYEDTRAPSKPNQSKAINLDRNVESWIQMLERRNSNTNSMDQPKPSKSAGYCPSLEIPVLAVQRELNSTTVNKSGIYVPTRTLHDAIISEVLGPKSILLSSAAAKQNVAACAIFFRGEHMSVPSLSHSVARFTSTSQHTIQYLNSSVKLGVCAFPSYGIPYSAISLRNTTAMSSRLLNMRQRCLKLFRVKAHWHHYAEFMEEEALLEALETVHRIEDAYKELEHLDL